MSDLTTTIESLIKAHCDYHEGQRIIGLHEGQECDIEQVVADATFVRSLPKTNFLFGGISIAARTIEGLVIFKAGVGFDQGLTIMWTVKRMSPQELLEWLFPPISPFAQNRQNMNRWIALADNARTRPEDNQFYMKFNEEVRFLVESRRESLSKDVEYAAQGLLALYQLMQSPEV